MIRRPTLLIWFLVLTFAAMLPDAALARCGKERWDIKTGTDPDARLVDLTKQKKTRIVAMRSWTAPDELPDDGRIAPHEATVYVVEAWLTIYREEDSPTTGDSDYHLVLTDDAGHTIIAEVPSPDCVGPGSAFLAGIRKARSQFDSRFNVTGEWQSAHIRVRITGVGMFDHIHHQTGVAPNGVQLHPVLDVVFNP